MTKDYLPLKVDPFKSAAHETQLHGHLKVSEMQRLCASLSQQTGEVQVNMVFGTDEQKVCTIKGHYQASLTLQCQRCMGDFNYVIMNDFIFGVLKNEEEAKNLPEEYLPVVAVDGMLVIRDMIEDELIINLPVVPMHDPDVCNVKLPFTAGSQEAAEVDNPFNVISILRSKDKNSK